MAGQPPDLDALLQSLVSYLGTASELAALRTRSPQGLRILKDPPERIEDLCPFVLCYLTDVGHRSEEDAASNEVQDWQVGFALVCAVTGEDFSKTRELMLDVASAVLDVFLGFQGKSLGTAGTEIYDAVLRRGAWDAENSDATLGVWTWSLEVSYRTG
jgi:hypothetical protein